MMSQNSQGANTMVNNRNVYHDQATSYQASGGGYIVQGGDNMQLNHTCVILSERSHSGGVRDREDLLSLLNPIPDASHTRNLNTSPPKSVCFPGTRQDVIADVHSWVSSSLKAPHIMWIYGFAGSGKSAVAQEVASHFDRKGQLAAAFFFFRGAGDRSRTGRFASTIASQVVNAIPATASHIKAALKKSPGLLLDTTSLTTQFDSLVYGPLKAVKWPMAVASVLKKPFLIVLDGLDECEDRDEIAVFIQHTINFCTANPGIPLRFVVTSRVENHIDRLLHSSRQVVLLDLVDRTSDSDIAAALDIAIDNEKQSRLLKYDGSWPSAGQKAKLLKHIGGSFIFMTTIVRYLFDPDRKDGLTPMRRLPIILKTNLADFDSLYRSILEKARHLAHFQEIISTVALALRPLSVSQIATLLGLQTVDIVNVLLHLNAIINIPGDDRTPITLWHTSLRDFLLSENRAGPIFASPAHHIFIARGCIRRAADSMPSATREYSRLYALKHLNKLPCDNAPDTLDAALKGLKSFLDKPVFKGIWPLCARNRLSKQELEPCPRTDGEGSNVLTALHAACHHKEFDTIYFLLDNGADPNIVALNRAKTVSHGGASFKYGTPLTFASYIGNVELATRLLECKADPNSQCGRYSTALQASCSQGKLEVVKLLLKHGADPNLTGGAYGSSLHACAQFGKTDRARALLEHKADPNVRGGYSTFECAVQELTPVIEDWKWVTALHNACYHGHTNTAELLLDFGADSTQRNNSGRTAFECAMEKHKRDSDVTSANVIGSEAHCTQPGLALPGNALGDMEDEKAVGIAMRPQLGAALLCMSFHLLFSAEGAIRD
ncbi:hypothetical protein NMY22_g13584 [Coprinellus aureogranulatus]|nr:hypothetical protein NMY22_g13584 [Coprinellus aureogranulatus]